MAKMAKGSRDEFTNIVYGSVTETAANTLTFQKIETGYGSLDKTAWLIQRLEYYPTLATVNENDTAADIIQIAITKSNLLSSLVLSSSAVLDLFEFRSHFRSDIASQDYIAPWSRNFTDLAGGGLLVLPYPLYLGIKCTAHISVGSAQMRMFFSTIELSDAQWVELVEQTRLLT